ncbi:gamma-aminobutyric acid receptor subunit beta-1-like [Actinia tenebrosa]|uniref:Gamma-aminobutyric acid receptor subunit beta n=1 Tax=Actinia tenebrosa TaxID=6105 RepID=A0A6P8I393_ACTTE|nr:gamma-aminobutyric acid receptor subunit beta-1-like [Actinia tenebrosa]
MSFIEIKILEVSELFMDKSRLNRLGNWLKKSSILMRKKMMTDSLLFQKMLIICCIGSVQAASIKARDYSKKSENVTKAIDDLLVGYDNRLRPYFGGIPLNISVYITVVSISNVIEKDMEFSLDLFFKQSWNDPRLSHSVGFPLILPGKLKENIWIPDTFILNVKTAKFHNVPASNVRIVIEQNGQIELSERLTVTASCRMDLRRYPLDIQTCALEILSYSYDVNDIDYYWKPKEDLIILDPEMSEFELSDYKGERKQVKYVIGTYIHLVANFVLQRRLAYSFIQIYSPTFLIVVLSWLSFWISKDAVPARVALGITTVLTIVTLMGSLRNTVPKVSYIKAIDCYLIVSFLFVFGVLLEYIAVLMHSQHNAKKKMKGKKIKSRAHLDIDGFAANITYRPSSLASSPSRTSMSRLSYNDPTPIHTSRIHLAPPGPGQHPHRRSACAGKNIKSNMATNISISIILLYPDLLYRTAPMPPPRQGQAFSTGFANPNLNVFSRQRTMKWIFLTD